MATRTSLFPHSSFLCASFHFAGTTSKHPEMSKGWKPLVSEGGTRHACFIKVEGRELSPSPPYLLKQLAKLFNFSVVVFSDLQQF